jgi:hypothetical protein
MQSSKLSSISAFHHTYLNEQEVERPELAISKFFELFSVTDARQGLWLWLNETLAAQDTHYENAENRANLLLVYNQLLCLLDASYILNRQYTQQVVKTASIAS